MATTALQSLGSGGADVKKEVATTALQTLGATDVGAKTEVATPSLQSLGANAVDAKKEIATTALQTLSAEEREEVVGQVHGPTQKVSDRIWQWVVGAFAVVFIGASGTLVASVFFLAVEVRDGPKPVAGTVRDNRPALRGNAVAHSLPGASGGGGARGSQEGRHPAR